MLKKVVKKVAKGALGVAKVPLKVTKGVVKHRRKIVGGALLTGAALTALTKVNPKAGMSVVKGIGHGAMAATKVANAIKK